MPQSHRARLAPRTPRRFQFVLVPDFSMMPYTAAIESLRAANRESGAELYDWHTVTIDGQSVRASNHTRIAPDCALTDAPPADVIVVCSGLHPESHDSPALVASLRRAGRMGTMLGAVCTGSVILARAGLLDGYRCTIHWEDVPSFAENFPHLDVTDRLFEIDRDRFTCSGGTAPLDLMLHFIGRDYGHALALEVADLMLHHATRMSDQPQRLSLRERTGLSHVKLLDILARMEAAIEEPQPIETLAAAAGLSQRQCERLFHDHLATTPHRHYLQLRLKRARHLLQHTSAPVMEIGLSTGFASAAHFAKCYREAFGRTPRAERLAKAA